MPRPPLVLETWGKINRTQTKSGTPMATAKYRDSDGRTRRMSKTGATPHKAEQALIEALRDRLTPTSEDVTATSRLSVLSGEWWDEWLAAKPRPIGTERRYRGVLENHILVGLGGITVREATTARIDRFLKATTKGAGYSTAAIAKVILSGMMGLAARYGVFDSNPVTACAPIPKPERTPVAWDLDQIAALRAKLRAWDSGVDKQGHPRVSDLADPSDFMLGTAVRIGELLAVRWNDIDFAASPPTVRIHATVVRSRSYGLMIQEHTKSKNVRILAMPSFVSALLMERYLHNKFSNELVFPSSTGTIRSPDNFRVQFQQAVGAEMPKTFRSSTATKVAKDGGRDKAQSMLGHSSVTVTEKFYLQNDEYAPDVTDILELLVTGTVVSEKDQ